MLHCRGGPGDRGHRAEISEGNAARSRNRRAQGAEPLGGTMLQARRARVSMDLSAKRRGHYFGTEIDEKWWRRYARDGLLARGAGDYWVGDSAFFFRRYLTRTPIVISFVDVLEVKLGTWHAGRWAGGTPVVKIVWKKAEERLSSGFGLSRDPGEIETVIDAIRHGKDGQDR